MTDQWAQFPDAAIPTAKDDPWAAFPDADRAPRPINSSTTDPTSPVYVYRQEAPGPAARFGRGMMDVFQGVTQRALQAEDILNRTLGPAVDQRFNQQTRKLETIPRGPDPTSSDYTAQVNNELALYDKGREGQGFDWMRAGGAGAATLPLAFIGGGSALPITTGARAVSRAVMGAKQGGAAGILQFDPTNSLSGVTKNALIGGGSGAVAAPVVGFLGDKVSEGARWLFGRLQGLSKSGIPMTDKELLLAVPEAQNLPIDARQELLKNAQDMILKTGAYDSEQLSRKANILRNGGTPLRSMVTRDPTDWTRERNLQKLAQSPDEQMSAIGGQLTRVYQGNDAAFSARLQDLQSGLPSATSEGHGQTIITTLDGLSKASQRQVKSIYDSVKAQSGDQLASDARQLVNTLDDLRDNAYASKLVDSVNARLKRFGMLDANGKLTSNTLTVTQSEELRKFVNALPNDYGKSAIIKAIDSDVISGAGSDAMATARNAASSRFGMLGNASTQKALDSAGALTEGQTARRFVASQLISGSEKDVSSLMGTLRLANDGGEGVRAAQAGMLQWIESKAVNPDSGKFSGVQLARALRTIGDSKLSSVLGGDTLEQLKSLSRAGIDATYEPAYSAVNNSNTAPMLLSLTQGARSIPGVNYLIPEEAQKAAARVGYESQVRKAMAAAPNGTLPQTPRLLSAPIGGFIRSVAPVLGAALDKVGKKPDKPSK